MTWLYVPPVCDECTDDPADRIRAGTDDSVRGVSLCSGIGGLELGLRLAIPRYRTVVAVERQAFPATLLGRNQEATGDRFPIWDDLTTLDLRPWAGELDLLSAGVPCQPFSCAGQMRGLSDERWLWDDVARLIGESGVATVVLECTPQLRRLGLPDILRDLAALGFDAVWSDSFTAEACGAPHKRARFFLFAQRISDPNCVDIFRESWAGQRRQPHGSPPPIARGLATGELADTDIDRRNGERHGAGSVPEREWGSIGDDVGGRSIPVATSAGRVGGDRVAVGTCASHGQGRGGRPQPMVDAGDEPGRTEHGSRPATGRERTVPGGAGLAVEDTGRVSGGIHVGEGGELQSAAGSSDRGVARTFPPGPADPEGWADYLEQGGPSPQLRRGIDGDAAWDYRNDRLHALGNGVVPIMAAYAVRTLGQRLGLNVEPWASGDTGTSENGLGGSPRSNDLD